jgi:hypothetical protein
MDKMGRLNPKAEAPLTLSVQGIGPPRKPSWKKTGS